MSTAVADPSDQLRTLLDPDETIRWWGKPHRRRLLLDAIGLIVPVLIVLGMFGLFVAWIVAVAIAFSGGDPAALIIPGLVVVAVVVGLVVAVALWLANKRYVHAEYAATEHRLIAFSGALGRDHSSVGWESVRDLEVTVGALDGLFGTGTIHVATEGRGDLTFRSLEQPHELAASLDRIRTDATPATEEADEPVEPDQPVATTPDRPTGDEPTSGPVAATRAVDAGPVSETLRGMLRRGEELRWHYRPPTRTYLAQMLVGGLLVGLVVWTIFYVMVVGLPVLFEFGPVVEEATDIDATIAVVAGWSLVQVGWLVVIGLASLNASGRLEFAATDRRAIKIGGMVGLDTDAVDWEDTTDLEIKRSLMTHLFGTGRVVIRSGGRGGTARGGGLGLGPITDPTATLERLEAVRRGTDTGDPILVGTGRVGEPSTAYVDADRLSGQARRLLRNGEALVWHGRPSPLPFVLPQLAGGLTLAGAGAALVGLRWSLLFGVLLFLSGVSTASKRVLAYRNVEYLATDQRVVAFGGAIGRDSSSVEWDDIQDVEVRTGAVDGPFETGTLRFSRAGNPTPAERQAASGDDPSDAFAGVQFRRIPDARSVAVTLERGRRD